MRSTFVTQAIVGLLVATAADAASLQNRAATCAALPAGAGPKPNPDTVAAFFAQQSISNAANGASTPKGYVKQFSNLKGATINVNQYLGVAFLNSYDVNTCAAKCNALKNCNSFNLYYERDPSLEPGSGNSGCANPCSTTNIKCAFFSGSVTTGTATNYGQFRNKFQVVIAGSNGYTNSQFLVNQARGEIGQLTNSAQPYCSSILGYTTPLTTVNYVTTTTPLGTQTSTGVSTDITTSTQIAATTSTLTAVVVTTTTLTIPVTQTNTELGLTTVTSTVPTTTTVSQTTTASTTTLSIPTTTVVTSVVTEAAGGFSKRDVASWTTINGVILKALPTIPANIDAQKRDISLPSVLSKYPASIITSACYYAVSPVTKTQTVTNTRTSTVNTVFAIQTTSTTTQTTATVVQSTTIGTVEISLTTTTASTISTTQVTTTQINTDVVPETTVVTMTSTISEIATATEFPVVTSTTLTTTSPPACTATNYRFQALNGAFSGQYLSTTDAPSYDFIRFADVSQASVFVLRSDGRVYTGTNVSAWFSRNNQLYYILAGNDARRAAYGLPDMYCSIAPSAAVATVPGAVGALTCRVGVDGPVTGLGSCASTSNNLVQSPNFAGAGQQCVAVTFAAIPVSGCPA